MTANPKLVNLGLSSTDSVELRAAIVDRTTLDGMKPEAITQLKAAVAAAQSAGLARVDIIAARGGDHKSHFAGTEWDVVGYNANGSKWNDDQRVLVAEGARRAGATRFGLYEGGNQTLHFGYGPPGFADNVTWGARGLTSGAASRLFSSAANRAFASRVAEHLPYLAYDEVATKPPVVPAQRAIDLQVAGAKSLAKALPKGKYGEENIISAALTGNPVLLKTAFGDLTKNVIKTAGWSGLDQATKDISNYFTAVGKNNTETAIQVRNAFTKSPELWSAVPAAAAPMLKAGFAAIAENPIAKATGVPLAPGAVVTTNRPVTAGTAVVTGADLSQLRARVLVDQGVLRKGDYNNAASGELQTFLNAGGFTDRQGRALAVDRDFGPLTRQAVVAYQGSKGLKPDGIVGPRTFSAIMGDVAAQQNAGLQYGDSLQPGGGIGSDAVTSKVEENSLQADITAADMMPVPQSAYYSPGSNLGGPPTNAQSIINAGLTTAARLRAEEQRKAQATPQSDPFFAPTPRSVSDPAAPGDAASETPQSGSGYAATPEHGSSVPTNSPGYTPQSGSGAPATPGSGGGSPNTGSNSGTTPGSGTGVSSPTPGQSSNTLGGGGIGHA